MPGIIIYKTSFQQHYCFDFPDQSTYRSAKADIRRNKDEILWKKGNVTYEQIKNSKGTTTNLVNKLNNGEKVDLAKELADFFKCD
jgi:hypothetical protein